MTRPSWRLAPPRTHPQSYLSDEDFKAVFKITKEEFDKKRPFEKDNLKKVHRLF